MGLVGRLVGGEPRIAINPHDGFVGWSDVARRKTHELHVHRRHQFDHRAADLTLKNLFARLKPRAPVVALELAQEIECGGRETGKLILHEFFSCFLSR